MVPLPGRAAAAAVAARGAAALHAAATGGSTTGLNGQGPAQAWMQATTAASSSSLLVVRGGLGAGKTSLLTEVAIRELNRPGAGGVVLVTAREAKNVLGKVQAAVPFGANFTVESIGGLASTIVFNHHHHSSSRMDDSNNLMFEEYDDVVSAPTQVQQQTHVLRSRAERAAFVSDLVFDMPLLPAMRPVLNPEQNVLKLLDYFAILSKCDVSPGAYREWVESHRFADNDDSKAHHTALCASYEVYVKAKRTRRIFDQDGLVTLAREIVHDSSTSSTLPRAGGSPKAWFAHDCDLLLLDDVQHLSPAQARLAGSLCKLARRTIAAFDSSSELLKFSSASRDNEPYIRDQFPAPRAVSLLELPPLFCGAKAQPVKFAPVPPAPPNEVGALAAFLRNLTVVAPDGGHNDSKPFRVAICTRKGSDRDALAGALQDRLKSEANLIRVQCEGGFDNLFETAEVRAVMSFLDVVARGSADSTDRELFQVYTSKVFNYKPGPGEVRMIGERMTREFASMRAILRDIPSGRKLLKDVETIELAVVGEPASLAVAQILQVTGVMDRIQNVSSAADEALCENLMRFVKYVTRVEEARLSSSSSSSSLKPTAFEMCQHLERIRNFGGHYVMLSDESSSEDEGNGGLGIAKENDDRRSLLPKNTRNQRTVVVHVQTLAHVSDAFEPGSMDVLVVARAADTVLPLKGRRASSWALPVELLSGPRPLDGVGEAGPFWDVVRHEPKERVHEEFRLLRTALSRLKPSGTGAMTVYYSHEPGEAPSKFLNSELSAEDADFEERASIVKSVKRTGKRATASDKPVLTLGDHASITRVPAATDDVVVLSYSKMKEYETCPKRYFYARVLNLKTPSNPAMLYGKSLHTAVETHQLYEAVTPFAIGFGNDQEEEEDNKKLALAEVAFLNEFNAPFTTPGAIPPQGFHSRNHIDQVREQGLRTLRGFHERWVAARSQGNPGKKIKHVERRFELSWAEAKISLVGVIDLVEENARGESVLVDYKSNVLDAKKLKRLAHDNDQLQLYSWASIMELGRAPDLIAIESLETGQRVEIVPPEDTRRIRERLADVASSIRQGAFPPTPSFGNCLLCPFQGICEDARRW